MKKNFVFAFCLTIFFVACKQKQQYDTIIRNGIIYDGNGGEPFKADVAIQNDTIAFIGDLSNAVGKNEIDAKRNAVAPGFINMMGHSEVSLIQDGRAQSDVKQGVTTEIFTESTMAPLSADMKQQMQKAQGDIKFLIDSIA